MKQHILADSQRSPKLILQVADLLSYILYESNDDYVTLEKELSVIVDYIALEENNLIDDLQMNITVKGDISGKYITPLILLSIVEAGFEFFPEVEQRQLSKLFIDVKGNLLDLHIIYNTAIDHSIELFRLSEKFEGIRKQLNNLYPDAHEFSIESQAGNITILLKSLPLYIPELIKEEIQTTQAILMKIYDLIFSDGRSYRD